MRRRRRENGASAAGRRKRRRTICSSTQVQSSSGRDYDDKGLSSSKKRRREAIPEVDEDEDDVSYTLLRKSGRVVDWDDYLRDLTGISWICPVDFFPRAPLAKQWNDFALAKVGTKIELPHPRSIGRIPMYSVATILAFAGYKSLVRFENATNANHKYAWITFCSKIPKPLGYSVSNNYITLPVEELGGNATYDAASHRKFIEDIYSESPLPKSVDEDHEKILRTELANYQNPRKFKLNDLVEVMDKGDPVRNRLALIVAIIGDRIQVKYVGADENDLGFCFNVKSELVHPFGWSHSVGQILEGTSGSSDTLPKLSKRHFRRVPDNVSVEKGMVFEVRHPFYPYKIATGVVKKKLKFGLFEAFVETNTERENAEFVFHVTSEYILPCGFCSQHKLQLEVPPGEDDSFTWAEYFKRKQVKPLIKENLYQNRSHRFVKGSKFEAVDVFEPMYLGPATVLNVAGHLLYIHFDGWPRSQIESYQWVSAFCGDIYPAGWAELVGHRLQGHVERHLPSDTFSIVNRGHK